MRYLYEYSGTLAEYNSADTEIIIDSIYDYTLPPVKILACPEMHKYLCRQSDSDSEEKYITAKFVYDTCLFLQYIEIPSTRPGWPAKVIAMRDPSFSCDIVIFGNPDFIETDKPEPMNRDTYYEWLDFKSRSDYGPKRIVCTKTRQEIENENETRQPGTEAAKAAPEPAPEQDAAQDAQTASKPAQDAYTASELIRRASRSADALPHAVSITVPGTIGSETASDARRDAETDTVMTALSSRFGGCTATPGRGSWIDGTGKLIAETVTVCTSYADSITPDDADFIGETARSLCARMAQDCVTITIDGLAAFVSA